MVEIQKVEPLVYFIVLNYCSLEDTIGCVQSIKEILYKNKKVIVLDNMSPDRSGDILSKKFSEKEFIQLPKNIGYAGGNNYAIEIALRNKADYIFIVNPDIRLSEDSLTEYLKVMENNSEIGAINPIQLSALNGPIDQRFYGSVLKGVDVEFIEKNMGNSIFYETETLFGASLLVSRKAIEIVGGFDPLYFAYGEEEDLCRRLKYFGFKIGVFFRFPVVHLRNYQDEKVNKFRRYLRLKGRYLYLLKDINKSLVMCLKSFYYELRADFKSQNGKIFKNLNYYKMITWFLIHFFSVIKSRNVEKEGFSHLSIQKKNL